MRIGFDAKRLFNNFTGLGNYSRFVVSALREHEGNNELFLFTPKVKRNSDSSLFLNSDFKLVTPSGIYKNFPLSGLWRTKRIGQLAQEYHLDIYHGLSNELPVGNPGSIPMVVTVHDLIFKRYPQFYSPVDAMIYSWKLRKACENASRIIAISEQTAIDLQDYLGIGQDKITVVYQGCHPNFKIRYDAASLEETRRKYGLPESFLLNVGTIEARKNALQIVKAVQRMKTDIPLVIVGRITAYKRKIEEQMRSGPEKKIIFVHDAAFEDLPKLYQLAKVFVYPSLFEGFGIPIVEAIACGVPVITSAGSCFSEAGGPGCVYVDPLNVDELANSLEQVLVDDASREGMIAISSRHIEKFEPPVIAQELMKLYKSVL